MPSVARMLPDGQRLHLHHGPIDLIIGVEGGDVARAMRRASERFETVLEELAAELPDLRKPLDGNLFKGSIAGQMARAVAPFDDVFVTPMAAVAGAVADEMRSCLWVGDVHKVYVNNGGDIAFDLRAGQSFRCLGAAGDITLHHADPVRGIATSGWRGRSHSLGIADAVTVLATSAACADVAATLIANAVDVPGHPGVQRLPATELFPDSDLGTRLVTTGVDPLPETDVAIALDRGLARAQRFAELGLIHDAVLVLQGQSRSLDSETIQQGMLTDA